MEENLSKNELMGKIMEYKFAANDMALFLNTHPCDEKALKLHNEYVSKLNEYKTIYESEFGPLTVYDDTNSWSNWEYESWPWERSDK